MAAQLVSSAPYCLRSASKSFVIGVPAARLLACSCPSIVSAKCLRSSTTYLLPISAEGNDPRVNVTKRVEAFLSPGRP